MTKTLFLTGASSGIGAATARAAAKAGWNIGLFARSEDKLNDLAAEIGDQALVLVGDATDYDAQKQAIDKLADHFGQVDVAFNFGLGKAERDVQPFRASFGFFTEFQRVTVSIGGDMTTLSSTL